MKQAQHITWHFVSAQNELDKNSGSAIDLKAYDTEYLIQYGYKISELRSKNFFNKLTLWMSWT